MGEKALQGPGNKIHMVASEAQLGTILHHPGDPVEVLFNDKILMRFTDGDETNMGLYRIVFIVGLDDSRAAGSFDDTIPETKTLCAGRPCPISPPPSLWPQL